MQTFLQTWWSSKIRRVVYFHCLAYDRGWLMLSCITVGWRSVLRSSDSRQVYHQLQTPPTGGDSRKWSVNSPAEPSRRCWRGEWIFSSLICKHRLVFPAAWSQSVTSNINKRLKHVPVVFRGSELDATEVSHSDQSDDFMWKTAWAKRK